MVWALLAVAVCLRVAALALLHGPDLVSASESGLTAANWVAGQGYTFDFYGYRAANPLQSFMPPLFTAVVAASLLTPWPAVTLNAIQVVLSTLTVLLVYLFAAQLAGQPVGLVAAALTAVYPPFLVLVDQPTVPVLNTFLLALWLWATTNLIDEGQWRWAAPAGLALGLNILSRPSSVGLLGVMVLGLWLRQ
jgi:4-amino-4-deoxy-L-arabinose transferase-like glycosyltransferase